MTNYIDINVRSDPKVPIEITSNPSNGSYKQLCCTGVLLSISLLGLLVISLPYQPFRSYYNPRPFQERNFQHLNSSQIEIDCLSKFHVETTCPISFFETISDLSLS